MYWDRIQYCTNLKITQLLSLLVSRVRGVRKIYWLAGFAALIIIFIARFLAIKSCNAEKVGKRKIFIYHNFLFFFQIPFVNIQSMNSTKLIIYSYADASHIWAPATKWDYEGKIKLSKYPPWCNPQEHRCKKTKVNMGSEGQQPPLAILVFLLWKIAISSSVLTYIILSVLTVHEGYVF